MIPDWLAQEAYAEYARLFAGGQSLGELTMRGGFGQDEALDLVAGGTGSGLVLRRLRATRNRTPAAARREIVVTAMKFAGEATVDPVKQEAMALLILRATQHFATETYRLREITQALASLTKADQE